MIEIVQVTHVTPDLVTAMAGLIPQLNPSCQGPTPDELRQIVQSPTTVLLTARDPDSVPQVVGVLTLAVFRIPTGVRAWIEDVVVDARARGRGIGQSLCQAAMDRAKAMGAVTVDLTSRSDREAANRLYQRMGFQRRDTNLYRLICLNEQVVRGPRLSPSS